VAKTGEVSRLAYSGVIFRIEFYVRPSGEALAEEWLESQSASMQAKFAALFTWLGDQGRISNERKFKHLTDSNQIFELKADDERILCFFFSGQRVILTHGFRKKGNKTPKSEIERAERLKREFETRAQR